MVQRETTIATIELKRRVGMKNARAKSNLTWAKNWDHGNQYAQSVLRRLQKAEAKSIVNGVLDKNLLKTNVQNALKEIAGHLAQGLKYRYP